MYASKPMPNASPLGVLAENVSMHKTVTGLINQAFSLARSHRWVVRSSARKTHCTDRPPVRGGATIRTGSSAPGCSATQGGTVVASPNQDPTTTPVKK